MANRESRSFRETKKVLSARWSASDLHIPVWVVHAIIYITVFRSLVYGLDLLLVGTSSMVSPLLAFASILGIPTWGFLMVASVAVLLTGMWTRNNLTVTVGALLCMAVWVGFSLVVGLGLIHTGSGVRFAVAAFANAATWLVFFVLQLNNIRKNGTEA